MLLLTVLPYHAAPTLAHIPALLQQHLPALLPLGGLPLRTKHRSALVKAIVCATGKGCNRALLLDSNYVARLKQREESIESNKSCMNPILI